MYSRNLNSNKPIAKTTKLPTPLCKGFFWQSEVSSKVCCPYCQWWQHALSVIIVVGEAILSHYCGCHSPLKAVPLTSTSSAPSLKPSKQWEPGEEKWSCGSRSKARKQLPSQDLSGRSPEETPWQHRPVWTRVTRIPVIFPGSLQSQSYLN